MRIVILGYGAAAVGALKAVDSFEERNGREKIDVTVVNPEPHHPYSPMFLIEYVFGNLKRREFYLPTPSNCHFNLSLIGSHRVTGIRSGANTVLLDDGARLEYDRLLIATGASAYQPQIKGLDQPGVFFINRLDDALRLRERVKQDSKVIIVGAGALGIETALALACQGQRVTIVEAMGQILPLILDEDLASYVQGRLEERGINLVLNSPVSEVTGKRRAEGVIAGGQALLADLVVMAAGFKPNIEFIDPAEIKTARGILVNERMQTSAANIYAAGDVAEARNPFLDRYELNLTWYKAIEQGWVAGGNLAGAARMCFYSPSLNVLKGLDFTVASIGQKLQGKDHEIISYQDEKAGIIEKFYVRGNYIEHYQAIGLPYKLGYIYNLIKNRKNISRIKPFLTTNTPEVCCPIFLTCFPFCTLNR